MPAVGLALLALAATPAADKVTLSGLLLERGVELVYRGEVVETSDGIDGRLTKKYGLDVRVFVLEARKDGCDCAVMTVVSPKADEQIAAAVKAASGTPPKAGAAAAVRLELVRVNDRGRATLLRPDINLPLTFDNKTPTATPPAASTDGPAPLELGMFLPLPITSVGVGDTWDTTETSRPPVVWAAKQTAVWNGRQVADVIGVQQTDGYDTPRTVRFGWQRTEAVSLSPADGIVSTLTRTVVRREGVNQVGSITTTLELQPASKLSGEKYRDTRAEVEAAWAFATEIDQLKASRMKADVLEAHRREVLRFADQRPSPTGFRPALEAVLRRYETNAAPPVTPRAVVATKADPPTIDKPAPDFVCTDVDKPTNRLRLSGVRGKPAVVVFFKPVSETSEETLTVCEALHRKFGERVTVIPLAMGGDLLAASKQRATLKYTVPVFDGTDVRDLYAVRSYPHLFVIDGGGTLRWAFDAGIGPEVGKLVKGELEKLMK